MKYDKFGRSGYYNKITVKDKLQDANIVKVNFSLREHPTQLKRITEQRKEINCKMIFLEINLDDFLKK